MKKIALIIFIITNLISCSQLTTNGRLVQVWEEMTPSNSADHREIGEVSCKSKTAMVTRNFNRKRCKEGLMNAASRLGGAIVVIENEKLISGFMRWGVEITGTAYKNIR